MVDVEISGLSGLRVRHALPFLSSVSALLIAVRGPQYHGGRPVQLLQTRQLAKYPLHSEVNEYNQAQQPLPHCPLTENIGPSLPESGTALLSGHNYPPLAANPAVPRRPGMLE